MPNEDPRTDLGASIAYWASEHPGRIALDDGKRQISYADFDHLASSYAAAMLASGLEKGDRIAWLGKNAPLYFLLLVAASRAGLVMAPVGWRLAEPEIQYILADTGARFLACEPQFGECARLMHDRLESLRTVVVDGSFPGLPSLADWLHSVGTVHLPETDPDDAVLQLYTSGTTGSPKGAVLSNGNLYALRDPMKEADFAWNRFEEGDAYLDLMPVAHIAGSGLGNIAFYHGLRLVLRPEFSPEAVFEAVESGATHTFLVPTALHMVVSHPRAQETDWSKLRYVLYGAAPMPLELLRACMKVMGAGFCQQYGMTETTGAFCVLQPEDHDPDGNDKMLSAGTALPGVEIKVVGEDGAELPRGEIGEVVTRSALIMKHYWNAPEKTAETIDPDGWLHTGDAGYMDADGYVFIRDRVKDMIVSGGENVYPAEVENTLFAHPDIFDVAVIGVPDDKWGEAVKAVVVPEPGHGIDAGAIIAWARERLAGYKVPKSVDVVEALPRNATGKVLRRELRAPYWDGGAADKAEGTA